MRTASGAFLVMLARVAAGGGDRAAAPAAEPVGHASAGSVVQYADCDDWRAGTRAEREATVVVLRGQLTPTHSKDASSPLSDERAYELLDKSCSQDYASSMRLYKLYARAQGFSPLSQ